MIRGILQAGLFILCLALAAGAQAVHPDAHVWTTDEVQTLKSLWLGSLPPVPENPSNRYSNDYRAVSLGRKLFFDKRLSANGQVACSTCHMPDRNFTDNLPVAHGMDFTTRRSMPLAGVAYSPWLFWDGRADSLWAQALGPIESSVEHGISRTRCALIVYTHYRNEYEDLFGPMPEFSDKEFPAAARPAPDNAEAQALWDGMTEEQRNAVSSLYANLGKSIAAYVRTIMPGPSRFDRYVKAALDGDQAGMEGTFTPEEAMGLKVFIGKGQCINCHNGPLLTNNEFHSVGVPQPSGFAPDRGRAEAIRKVQENEFNCLGKYSDARPEECAELRFMDTDEAPYEGAFKTPSLRNVAERPPYMHAGQFSTLRDVLKHYQKVAQGRGHGGLGRPDIAHGQITDEEVQYLEMFLRTLTGSVLAAQ